MNYTFLWEICLPAKLSAGDLNFFWVLASFFSPVPISLQYLLSFSVEQYFFHGDKGIAFRLQGIYHLQRRRYGSGVVVVH